jgi:hypothetical protein
VFFILNVPAEANDTLKSAETLKSQWAGLFFFFLINLADSAEKIMHAGSSMSADHYVVRLNTMACM